MCVSRDTVGRDRPVVAARSAFDSEPYRPYNVGPDALLVNFKAVTLRFIPDEGRREVRVAMEPLLADFTVGPMVAGDGPCGDWKSGIAADFTRYDEHAVQQINRNIELIRYRRFGDELLLLELVNAVTVKAAETKPTKGGERRSADKTVTESLASLKGPLLDAFEGLRAFLAALGDDVQEKRLSLYIAFKRLKNFVCIEIRKDKLMLYLKLDPDALTLEAGFSRDVRSIGHWGTGDLELTIRNDLDFEKAKPLLIRSYENG